MLTYSFFLTPYEVRALTPQQQWENALIQCESGGKADIKVLDSNDKYSYGILQFQMATWLTYSTQFKTTPGNIYDPDLQKTVSLFMLNSGGWQNWYNCSTKFVIPSLGTYPSPDTS